MNGNIYGMYFMAGLSCCGVMAMLYMEIRKLVSTAVKCKETDMISKSKRHSEWQACQYI
jgi:hypothetical protein